MRENGATATLNTRKNMGCIFWVVETFQTGYVIFFEWKPKSKDDATSTTSTREDYMVKTMNKLAEEQKHQEQKMTRMLNIITFLLIFVIVLNGAMYISIVARLYYN